MTEPVRWLTEQEQLAWRSFIRLQDRLRGRLARRMQTESGVSTADFAVLVQLTDVPDGRRRVLDLARVLEWEKSRMSHHVARMEKRGLVARFECPEDGRGSVVVVTGAGRAMVEEAAPRHVEAVRDLFLDHVTPAELRVFAEVAERIVGRIDAEECAGAAGQECDGAAGPA